MQNVKVLIIDDDPMTCDLVETILEMENYQTASVNHVNKDGIIPILETTRPDIVILDYHMGSQDTLTHVKTVKNNHDWRHLPILMTSAIDRRKKCLNAGATDFILKPFNWEDLTNYINNIRDDMVYQEA